MKKGERKPRVALVCEVCGKGFELLPCQLGRGRGKTCSKACREESGRRGIRLFCDYCDQPFYKQRAELDSDRHFCSVECYRDWRAEGRTSYPKDGARHRHRVVAEQVLGRALMPGEVVHHVDEDKQNCMPENLCVFPSQAMHASCHQGNLSPEDLDKYRLLNLASGA